ncbi:hypothetical protein BAE44_0026032 [Dichanthelium oligosanthes]|uniref:Pentatricopeptide repeat-containing protein n=1 Tax=Dichanthelium oligosanthes TaxID=888268 RepID=A0A1E5UJF4_9POAL|nr:hypothetical protein BAE44_0026032 [Dichanthelium oligosanthes]
MPSMASSAAAASSSLAAILHPLCWRRLHTPHVAGRAPPDSKNVAALSAELRRLARAGRLPSALSLLDHLSHRGVPATASAFAELLSACCFLQVHARHYCRAPPCGPPPPPPLPAAARGMMTPVPVHRHELELEENDDSKLSEGISRGGIGDAAVRRNWTLVDRFGRSRPAA